MWIRRSEGLLFFRSPTADDGQPPEMLNDYSSDWFAHFLDPIPIAKSEAEVAFIAGQIEPCSTVVDVPCGRGRHSSLLANAGHDVIAVDREHRLLGPPGPRLSWICADMRQLPLRAGSVDAILCLWQSFGYFDSESNETLLRDWRELVRPGGRLVLDIYHRTFFERRQKEGWTQKEAVPVKERRTIEGDRLRIDLLYASSGGMDSLDWQIFDPEEIEATARRCGWELRIGCSGFDATHHPSADQPRAQYVFDRVG